MHEDVTAPKSAPADTRPLVLSQAELEALCALLEQFPYSHRHLIGHIQQFLLSRWQQQHAGREHY
jgi:hypothetical protein